MSASTSNSLLDAATLDGICQRTCRGIAKQNGISLRFDISESTSLFAAELKNPNRPWHAEFRAQCEKAMAVLHDAEKEYNIRVNKRFQAALENIAQTAGITPLEVFEQFKRENKLPIPDDDPDDPSPFQALLEIAIGYAKIEAGDPDGLIGLHKGWKFAHQFDNDLRPSWSPIFRHIVESYIPPAHPETRHTQIMPQGLRNGHRSETQEKLPVGLFSQQGAEQQLMIPGMIQDESAIVPAFPLEVFEASDGKPPERGGKGAPLSQRIWVNAILALPYAQYDPANWGWKLTTTLRDIKDWAYPKGWHRANCLPRIQQALYDVHNMRTRWERRLWNIVQVFALPDSDTALDDPLPLMVRLPDGMPGEGPMINVTILRLLGVESAPQFRAWIKLAYIWDDAKRKNNGHRIYTTRPKVLRNNREQATDAKGNPLPNNNWNHPKAVWLDEEEDNPAIKHVPVLTDDDLIRLFFDDTPVSVSTRRTRLEIAKKELAQMDNRGFVTLQHSPHGVRILEPKPHELNTLHRQTLTCT